MTAVQVLTVKTPDNVFDLCSSRYTPDTLQQLPYYDDITYMKCCSLGWKELPSTLPPNLQILICRENQIHAFPKHLPTTLRSIMASFNNISQLPDMKDLVNLEQLDLLYNSLEYIENCRLPLALKELNLTGNKLKTLFVVEWPNHLVELSLSYNHLSKLDSCFDKLYESNPNCKVDLNYNDFPSQKYNAYTVWLSNTGDGDDDESNSDADAKKMEIVNRHAKFGISTKVRVNGMSQPTNSYDSTIVVGTTTTNGSNTDGNLHEALDVLLRLNTRSVIKSTYNDAHNVHASSVQNSCNESVAALLALGPLNPMAFREIGKHWKSKRWWNPLHWLHVFRAKKLLETWCASNTIHSVHGITYVQLISAIWNAVKGHKDRKEILSVLMDEIVDADGVCFTGRFTRTLNALTGFVDNISVGISSKEQMQNRIVQVLHVAQETYGYGTSEYGKHAKEKVYEILTEFNVPKEEHAAWLDAI